MSSAAESQRPGLLCQTFAPLVMVFHEAPGFWKVLVWAMVQVVFSFGVTALIFSPAISTAFGDDAATVMNLTCVGTPFVAIIFANSLGRWSDRHDRRWSAVLLVVGSQGPFLSLVALGPTKLGVSLSLVGCALAGPMRAQISGNPLQWALLCDKLPPKCRDVGFQMYRWVPNVALLIAAPAYRQVFHAFPVNGELIFRVLFVAGIFLQMLIIWSFGKEGTVGSTTITRPLTSPAVENNSCGVEANTATPTRELASLPAMESSCDAEREQGKTPLNFAQNLRNAIQLLRSDRELILVTVILSIFTLPDLAATYPGSLIEMQIMGISGAGNKMKQTEFVFWQSTWPRILGIIPDILISLAADRFGAAPAMVVWMPITCLAFATPALLLWRTGPFMYVLVAFCTNAPNTCFPALQSFASKRVPHEKVAVAMSAIATFKDMMAFLAPLLMSCVMTIMKSASQTEHELSVAYAWIFPGCAAIMLSAWPLVLRIARQS